MFGSSYRLGSSSAMRSFTCGRRKRTGPCGRRCRNRRSPGSSRSAVTLACAMAGARVGDVAKRPRPQVAEDQERLAGQRDHRDVRPPIVVVVAENRSHAGDGLPIVGERHARGESRFLEPLRLDVVEEKIRQFIVGHERIGKAVAVVVVERHTHAAADEFGDAGAFADVFERAVAAVAVQRVGRIRGTSRP
jgi:hypothetical protein